MLISPVALVFRALSAAALLFLGGAVWQVSKAIRAQTFPATVMERKVQLYTGEVSQKRGTAAALFARYILTLYATLPERSYPHTVEERITPEQFTTLEFLDPYPVGAVLRVTELPGEPGVNLQPGSYWMHAAAFVLAAVMFGVFAWIMHPFLLDLPRAMEFSMGWRILALLIPLLGGIALPFFFRHTKPTGDAVERVPVKGYDRERMPVTEAIREIQALGVQVDPGVAPFMGESISFREYEYNGNRWRTTSLYCQPPPDQFCNGSLNPSSPRDVKWEGEP